MRTKSLKDAKLVIKVLSDKKTKRLTTVSIFDNRTNEFWSKDRIKSRGVEKFLNIDDLKETLNWNLNGDDSKYQFRWGQSGKETSDGYAYVFDQKGVSGNHEE